MIRTQIDGFRAELNESKAKLTALQEKLDELESKKTGCQSRIALAKSKCDQYTRSDVIRFKGESSFPPGHHGHVAAGGAAPPRGTMGHG
jgi:hypothetical protein